MLSAGCLSWKAFLTFIDLLMSFNADEPSKYARKMEDMEMMIAGEQRKRKADIARLERERRAARQCISEARHVGRRIITSAKQNFSLSEKLLYCKSQHCEPGLQTLKT